MPEECEQNIITDINTAELYTTHTHTHSNNCRIWSSKKQLFVAIVHVVAVVLHAVVHVAVVHAIRPTPHKMPVGALISGQNTKPTAGAPSV